MPNPLIAGKSLLEAIFELFWELEETEPGGVDQGYDLAQGQLRQFLKEKYPVHKRVGVESSLVVVLRRPIHQYWRDELQYPVIQHGMGMVAVNTGGELYDWEGSFFPAIVDAMNGIHESYEKPRKPLSVRLQYINGLDVAEQDPVEFMADRLHTDIKTQYALPGKKVGIFAAQTYEVEEDIAMQLNFRNGVDNISGGNVVMWTILIEHRGELANTNLPEWLKRAHQVASDTYKLILNPNLQ